MADEKHIEGNPEVAAAVAPTEVSPAKKRGPRQKKTTSDAASEATEASSAAPAKRGRKPKENTQARAPKARAKDPAKSPKTSVRKQPIKATVPVLDEIADLVQLEEENVRLRKTLAEKLRAENADLRKRLGLA
ncbi:SyrB-like regulator [Ensifer sp. ENS07]|uniref:SyrB-like regulator n=1 Tax=unclassified Ensifer TaxID=2633371 RepID=UPI001780319D|nr:MULTISPECIES: SyrB-like regulator [unclassified Ensifer]MBD9508005.1 SyrB-like regulator [Ensifer sp. ENS10]MBD9637499.1 SyrB-like regulator [Ensifer sp. ENS07]